MNTRVSITPNGPPHLGHAYIILLNEQVAHNSDGLFFVRFDDAQPYWQQLIGDDAQRQYAEEAKDMLDWLGVPANGYQSEASWLIAGERRKEDLLPGFPEMTGELFWDFHQFRNVAQPEPMLYPYVPWLTLAKVIFDNFQGITHIIRGEELATEASLYCYFCQRLSFPIPVQIFVPRLQQDGGEDLADVSKTKGNFKLCDLKKSGWTPNQIHDTLRRSCLKDPCGDWSIANLKRKPVLAIE